MKIVECPRDAMQGIKDFIPTSSKIRYINHLMKVGFHTIDVGSFVSHKAVPQMRDTSEVIDGLDIVNPDTKLLTIIANIRGALEASEYSQISYLGFPLSVSEEFQYRNTNKTINQSLIMVEQVQDICIKKNKELVIYLSMAFGNPYGEHYHTDIVAGITSKLNDLEIPVVSLSDTTGVSNHENISNLFITLIKEYPDIEFGAHFHSLFERADDKIKSAYFSGCRRFDSAINGYGGCPMAQDDLVGNIATEQLIHFMESQNLTYHLSEFDIAVNNFQKIILGISNNN